jgi:hypothetical protein
MTMLLSAVKVLMKYMEMRGKDTDFKYNFPIYIKLENIGHHDS